MAVRGWCVTALLIITLAWAIPVQANPPESYAAVRLEIPSLGIDTPLFLMDVRLNAQGAAYWHINPYERAVGHLEGTPWLGEGGNTVLGGHARYPNGVRAVFGRLHSLEPGALIILHTPEGRHYFTVRHMEVVLPSDVRVAYNEEHRLTLITCSGDYDPRTRDYSERVAILADPLPVFD